MRITTVIMAAMVGGLAVTTPLAVTASDSKLLPGAEFVAAYIYACQPVEYDFAGVREPLNEVAGTIYDQLFLRQYGGSCRDFYFEEVVERLDVELQPYFEPVAR